MYILLCWDYYILNLSPKNISFSARDIRIVQIQDKIRKNIDK